MSPKRPAPKFTMPSVYRPKTEKTYRAKIGYIADKNGRRVRQEFRLGVDELVATKKALNLAEKWLRVEQWHQNTQITFQEMFPNHVPTMPVWTDMPERQDEGREAYLATPPEDLPGDEITQSMIKAVSVEQAAQDLLKRIKEKADRDAKSFGTHSWYEQQFRLGLVRPAVDPDMAVHEITLTDVERYCGYWCHLNARALESKAKSFGWQTAKNRIDAFAYLLRDLTGRVKGYNYPERADAIIDEAKRTVAGDLTTIHAYSADRLKAVLARGNDRLRLTVYLALNCGMYQSDIGQQIRRHYTDDHGGLIEIDGETYLQWERHKLKRRQRVLRRDQDTDVRPVLLTHYIWPETLALLNQFAAPEHNSFNLWLLNQDGMPLWQYKEGQKRPLDSISTAYYRAAKAAEARLPFDQFRKFGATASESLGCNEVQEMYRGERRRGSSRVYVLKDFTGQLTPFLKAWAERLRSDGVLY